MRQVPVEGRDPIALYRLQGAYYATDDVCSHGQAFLTEGEIEGCEVVCPFHEGTFDIRTGEAVGAPCFLPIRSYPVTVGPDGVVYVEVE